MTTDEDRKMFAAVALHGFLCGRPGSTAHPAAAFSYDLEALAELAVNIADLTLAQLEKRK